QSDDLSFRNTLQQSIDKTFSIVTDEMIHNCAKKILSSTNVFIMARGTSKADGYYFEHLLLSIGIQCIFIKDYNLSDVFTNYVSKDYLFIFISLSVNIIIIVATA